jgi:anti-sigma-K factor RskA
VIPPPDPEGNGQVDQDRRQIDHREYEDLLSAAALGVLEPDRHALLLDHVRGCAPCRSALGRLQSAVDALPLTVDEMAPSSDLRDRLAARIAVSPRNFTPLPDPVAAPPPQGRPFAVPVPPARSTGRWAWLSVAAAMLVIGLAGGIAIGWAWLQGDDEVVDPMEIAMESPSGMDLSAAELVYMPDDGMIHFSDPEMTSPPDGMVYQVWLIEGEDTPPIPMGTIDMASGEFASTVDPARHRVFAVTVEPAPLGSAGPTSDPVIVATLPDATD